MGITVLKNNVPWGPFTRAQIAEGLERGDFTLQTLAHAPGMNGWLPLEELIHTLDQPLPPVPVTPDPPPMPTMEAIMASKPVLAPPPRLNDLPLPPPPPPLREKPFPFPPAPFFRRAIAFFIDCSVLFLPILLIVGLSAMVTAFRGWWENTDAETMRQQWELWSRNFHELLLLVAIGLGWIYGAGLECSKWQATFGKRWMGLKVTDAQGGRLGFLQASQRLACKYLSALPLFFGFFMALFSSQGLALHDRLAGTRVVRDGPLVFSAKRA